MQLLLKRFLNFLYFKFIVCFIIENKFPYVYIMINEVRLMLNEFKVLRFILFKHHFIILITGDLSRKIYNDFILDIIAKFFNLLKFIVLFFVDTISYSFLVFLIRNLKVFDRVFMISYCKLLSTIAIVIIIFNRVILVVVVVSINILNY